MEVRIIFLNYSSKQTANINLDISAQNVIFSSEKLSKLDKKVLFKIIGQPVTEEVRRLNGVPLTTGQPSRLVKTVEWGEWQDEKDEDVELIDFGGSFPRAGPRPDKVIQPGNYQAPEAIFTEDFDWRIDLWSLGITVSANFASHSIRN